MELKSTSGPQIAAVEISKKAPSNGSVAGHKTYQEFEATLLGTVFDVALPRSKRMFGQGAGGEFARSQLCQQLGQGVAASGAIGIARILEAMAEKGWQTK
ncbi:MAG: rod-binding protein [Proteobacteria bacterium]|nr:rod-binding protein [Pseudomonadota bacterium]